MPELYCVHINGPDELIAEPSKEIAQRTAEAINTLALDGAFSGLISATVETWPFPADLHAKDILNREAIFAAIDRP